MTAFAFLLPSSYWSFDSLTGTVDERIIDPTCEEGVLILVEESGTRRRALRCRLHCVLALDAGELIDQSLGFESRGRTGG
jgi:hypothetical protein